MYLIPTEKDMQQLRRAISSLNATKQETYGAIKTGNHTHRILIRILTNKIAM